MDIADLDLKALAAGRIAAQKRSGIRPAHCWFCNKIEAWFLCDCPEAREAQSDQAGKNGKRTKPRFDAKLGSMVLDEDIIQRNLGWGYARRYVPAKRVTPTVTPVTPSVDQSVTPADAAVTVGVTESSKATTSAAERQKRYRERRAKQKDTPP